MANIKDVILDPVDLILPSFAEGEEESRKNYLLRKAVHLGNLVNTRGPTGIATIPSGTVLGLSNASINFVTGTTTINSIDTRDLSPGITPGYMTTLIFKGSVTVTHNAAVTPGANAILLASSSNLSAALNTVLTLLFDGTVWQEISRKLA